MRIMRMNILGLLDKLSVIGKKTRINNEECVVYSFKGGTLTDRIDIECAEKIRKLVIVGMVNLTDLMLISKLENLEILE